MPTAEEFPHTDDRPVEGELQDIIVHLLKDILLVIWGERTDCFFGIDMGLYYDPDLPAIAPDGFLSLGVERVKRQDLRLSYVVWEENGVIPILAIEVVSKTPGGEYKRKKKEYANI
ncbi:MAG: Uma2 family endonuclease [Oscillatoria sp. SIO1A7]|nr:Uma2 family endonuclease [Oscillatoria sp. SIO1A7]